MLKVKNNIDLKVLEKFGFTDCSLYNLYCISFGMDDFINVIVDTREIVVVCLDNKDTLNKIYDLINAEIVEKVG